jgi:PPOX class probable F420-dependent enzyme
MNLPDDLLTMLRRGGLSYIATTAPDGAPQLTQTWIDTDGTNMLVNTVIDNTKTHNVEEDPRVSLAVFDPAEPHRFFEVRGEVVERRTEGAAEHIEELAQRYTGEPYPWFGGRDQVRVVLVIEPHNVSTSS